MKKKVKKLKHKFRLVILDEFLKERFSFQLTPLNVFIWTLMVILFIIVLIISLIIFTPLKEFIPGYTNINLRNQLIYLNLKADSLEYALKRKDNYIKNINSILTGKIPETPNSENLYEKGIDSNNEENLTDTSLSLKYKPSKSDSELRAYVEKEEEISIKHFYPQKEENSFAEIFLFCPIKGIITNTFNIDEKHYGIDIVAPENEIVKSVYEGRVIISTWTLETGYILAIQHKNNLISIYKHNSFLFKKAGDIVKAGETISVIGGTGEYSTGPHLHFELWYKGIPLNPESLIDF